MRGDLVGSVWEVSVLNSVPVSGLHCAIIVEFIIPKGRWEMLNPAWTFCVQGQAQGVWIISSWPCDAAYRDVYLEREQESVRGLLPGEVINRAATAERIRGRKKRKHHSELCLMHCTERMPRSSSILYLKICYVLPISAWPGHCSKSIIINKCFTAKVCHINSVATSFQDKCVVRKSLEVTRWPHKLICFKLTKHLTWSREIF